MRNLKKFLVIGIALSAATPAFAHGKPTETLIVGVEEGGLAQWDLQAIQSLGLEEKHNIKLDIRPMADSAAAQAALTSGDVDLILSDFLWVSAQRSGGVKITMVPHSMTAGGLIATAASGIDTIDDLKGKAIAIGGGPDDESWVVLQADYHKATGGILATDATPSFLAPAAVNEQLAAGAADAAINDWQWNARATEAGALDVLSLDAMLTDLGITEQPPLLGWAFTDANAKTKKAGITQFMDASYEAEAALLSEDAAWDNLKDVVGAGDDAALFTTLRDGYRAGIVSAYSPSATGPAKNAFKLVAQYGAGLVGDKPTLDAGTFWRGFRK